MKLLTTSTVLAALVCTITADSTEQQQQQHWARPTYVLSPVQHYQTVWGAIPSSSSGWASGGWALNAGSSGSGSSGEVKALSGARYGASYTGSKLSHQDALEAHRQAVAEHQRAHAEALRRLDDARRSHKVAYKAAAAGSAGVVVSGGNSGEKVTRIQHAYGTPQLVYSGPKVTKEETYRLHADAINKQKKLVAQLDAINAQGPARAGSAGAYVSVSKSVSSGDDSGETYYYHPQPAVYIQPAVQQTYYSAPLVQEITQTYHQAPWTGPIVSSAETEYLHRDAIAKQQAIIRQQAQLIASKPRGSDSDESYETKAQDKAQEAYDQQNENALLARQEAEVQAQTLIAKQQGEQAKVSGAIEGAYRDDWSSEEVRAVGVQVGSGAYIAGGSVRDDSDSGETGKVFVPVYSSGSYVSAPYNGPKVTREETYALHADAINKQRAIIAQHEAFIASQRAAIQNRVTYQKAGDDSSESAGALKGRYYAASYYTGAPAVAVAVPVGPRTINVVGPAVTNYVSGGASLAGFYAAPKPAVTYVQPAGVYGSSSSGGSSGEAKSAHRAAELKVLAAQQAEINRQVQLAKEQGYAAAAQGAWAKGSSGNSGEVSGAAYISTPVQYKYYSYARPTFGYYTSAAPAASWVSAQSSSGSGNSGESNKAW